MRVELTATGITGGGNTTLELPTNSTQVLMGNSTQLAAKAGDLNVPATYDDTRVAPLIQPQANDVTQVNFYDNGVLVPGAAVYDGTQWNLNWTPQTIGVHTIIAEGVSACGLVAYSDMSVVTVVSTTAYGNQAPTISLTAPDGQVLTAVSSSVLLQADASDLDSGDHVTTVEFLDNGAPIGSGTLIAGTASNGTWSYSWTPTTGGSHVITARATDTFGAVGSTSQSATVVVATPPTVAITSPSNNDTLPAGQPVELDATVSSHAASGLDPICAGSRFMTMALS